MSKSRNSGSFFAGRAGGYRFVQADPKAAVYSSKKRFELPPKVDLRPLLTPVENQGNLNSCTANAIAGAYEYLLKKHLTRSLDVSRLFIYYNARWRAGCQDEDDGSVIQYGMESLKKYGACPETVWPYREKAVLAKPTKESYGAAARFRALDMQRVEVELDTWKKALAEGFPIVFGCVLFDSFDDCGKRGGVVPMPHPNEVKRGSHSRHAMLCVGYSDVDEVFVVRNSWGPAWGVQGYCYMPYDYLMSSKFNGGDCWILRSAGSPPNPQETWVLDETSIIESFGEFAGDVINAFAKEAYDEIEEAFFGHEDDDDGEWDETTDDDYSDDETDDEAYVDDDEDYADETDEDEEESDEEDAEEEEDEEEAEEESEDEESEEEGEDEGDGEDEESDEDAEEEEDGEETEEEDSEADEDDEDGEEEESEEDDAEEESEEEEDSEEESDDEGSEDDEDSEEDDEEDAEDEEEDAEEEEEEK